MATRAKLQKRVVDGLELRPTRYTVWDETLPGFGVKVMPSGRKSYIFKYRVGGGRGGTSREPVIGVHGEIMPDQARKIAKLWAAEVAMGQDPGGHRQEIRAAPTMAHLFDRYLEEHAIPHKKVSSVAEDKALLSGYLRPAFDRRKVRDVTRGEVARWHAGLAERPYRANRALALLSKAMNLAEVWGMRPDGSNPCRQVRKCKEERRERFLLLAEISQLGQALDAAEAGEVRLSPQTPVSPYAVAAIRLLLLTGARKSEILSMKWSYVDFDNGRADLPDSKTGQKTLTLNAAALAVLQAIPRMPGNPYVIVGGKEGAPLVNIRDPWHAIREAAGLGDVRLHDLRHSFASVGAAMGLSLPMIGALLGHRVAATTARYTHLADQAQREAAGLVGDAIERAFRAQ